MLILIYYPVLCEDTSPFGWDERHSEVFPSSEVMANSWLEGCPLFIVCIMVMILFSLRVFSKYAVAKLFAHESRVQVNDNSPRLSCLSMLRRGLQGTRSTYHLYIRHSGPIKRTP